MRRSERLRGVAASVVAAMVAVGAMVTPAVAADAASAPGSATPVAEISVYAAGSLRAALTDAAQAFERAEPTEAGGPSTRFRFTFGASGLLKDRLMAGERADLFASANMEHPQALAAAGKAGEVQRFTRNALCALVAPGVDVSTATLVSRMLDPAVKLGTSTPKADPSGDYAWLLFERIDQNGMPGAFKTLSGKALQLTGGPQSPPPPPNRNVYGDLVASGQADIFITYCTNAVVAVREQAGLRNIAVPAALQVSADYGATVLQGATPGAGRFMQFLLSEAGQAVLARHGFARR